MCFHYEAKLLFVEEYVMKRFCLIINPCNFTVINFLLSDQSVPLTVLHGDGPSGDHHWVVRHQHATQGCLQQSLPWVWCCQGDVPPPSCVSLPPAHPHLPLRHVRVQNQKKLQWGEMGHLCSSLHNSSFNSLGHNLLLCSCQLPWSYKCCLYCNYWWVTKLRGSTIEYWNILRKDNFHFQ